MNKQKELVKNTIIIAVGKLSTQFLTFLLLPLYTTFLTTKEFGTVDLIMTYVGIIVPLVAISVERAVFRHLIDVRDNHAEQARIITNAAQIYLVGILALTAIYAALSAMFTIPYSWLVYAVIVAVSISNFLMQVARGLGDNVKFSIASMIAGVVTVAANIVFIVGLGYGAGGMLISIALANVLCALYLAVALKAHSRVDVKLHSTVLKKELLGYSAPLVPSNMAWWAIGAADRTIIAIILGVSSNGVYAAAYKFPQIFNSLFSFFNMSWQESASVHINSPDRDKFYSQTMNASMKMFGALGLCVIAGTGLFFEVLVGGAFHEARQYIPILVVGVFFGTILEIYSGVYIAKKMTNQVFKTSLAAAVINIGLTLGLISWLGLYAPALAMCVAYLSMAIMRHYDLRQHVHITYRLDTIIKLAVLYVVVIGLYYCNVLATDLLATLVAVAAMMVLNRSFVAMTRTQLLRKIPRRGK